MELRQTRSAVPNIDEQTWDITGEISALLNSEQDAKRLSSKEDLFDTRIVPAEDTKSGNGLPIIVSVHQPNLVEHKCFQGTSKSV